MKRFMQTRYLALNTSVGSLAELLSRWNRVIIVLATLVMLKVLVDILLNYVNYFPARFDTGFLAHRHWMSRCFWLLCSTIFLRLMGGAAGLVHWNPAWTYPLSVWLSWIVPLAVYEIVRYSSKSIGNSTHIRV
jgi:hypothetical protein